MKLISEKTIEEIMALIGEAHFPNTPVKIVNAIASKLQTLEEVKEDKSE